MRVAFIAAECEPWAKTGGLGDVVDALARALGRIPAGPDAPVDVFLPRYRAMSLPDGEHPRRRLRVPDPMAPHGSTEVTVVDIVSRGYRLRLIDHPPAFDRAGYYGAPGGDDYPDNAWRFGLFNRAALETLRADGRPVDVLHLHDWHAAPGGPPARPVLRRRPGDRARRRPDHPAQPGLSRLGPARPPRPARAGSGRSGRGPRTRSASTCCGPASSDPSWPTRSVPASPPRR